MAESFTYTNPYSQALLQAEAQKRQGEQLRSSALDPMQGQMVGQHYVMNSPTQGFAKILRAKWGADDIREADKKSTQVATDRNKALIGALKGPDPLPVGVASPEALAAQESSTMSSRLAAGGFPEMAAQAMMQEQQQASALEQRRALLGDKLDHDKELALFKAKNPAAATTPSNIAEWREFQAMSPGEQTQYLTMKRANTPVNLGNQYAWMDPTNPAAPPLAAAPISIKPGEDPEIKGAQAAAVETARSAAERSAEAAATAPKRALSQQMTEQKNAELFGEIDKAIELADQRFTTGMASGVTTKIRGSGGYSLQEKLKTIKANLGFDRLQAMREASPTGGALGQVAVQELEGLQASLTSLDQGLEGAELIEALNKVKRHYESWQQIMAEHNARLDSQAVGGANPVTQGSAMEISRDQSPRESTRVNWSDL